MPQHETKNVADDEMTRLRENNFLPLKQNDVDWQTPKSG